MGRRRAAAFCYTIYAIRPTDASRFSSYIHILILFQIFFAKEEKEESILERNNETHCIINKSLVVATIRNGHFDDSFILRLGFLIRPPMKKAKAKYVTRRRVEWHQKIIIQEIQGGVSFWPSSKINLTWIYRPKVYPNLSQNLKENFCFFFLALGRYDKTQVEDCGGEWK